MEAARALSANEDCSATSEACEGYTFTEGFRVLILRQLDGLAWFLSAATADDAEQEGISTDFSTQEVHLSTSCMRSYDMIDQVATSRFARNTKSAKHGSCWFGTLHLRLQISPHGISFHASHE